MAGASLRVGANTSEFTSQMKSMLTQMKLVTSEYKVEAAQAKALGSQTDLLSAKKKELTAKIQLQTEAIKLQEGNLAAQKQKLTELQVAEQKLKEKVAELTAVYEGSVKATGKDSEESKKLKAQLDETKEAHAKAENAIKKQEDAIAKNTIKVNESRAALADQQTELKETEDNLESTGKKWKILGEDITAAGNSMDEAGGKAVSLGDIIKGNIVASAITGGVKLLADAFKELATNMFSLANDSQTALNTLSTQTGATAEELEEMQSIMDEIYNNNFGEDMDDIARAMATVKQQTGATGKELQNLTEEALLMRDTFDMDVNESVRTANMLMNTFGLTGEQAYSMIAQGAQKGLDKNGDLLDTINEYSVHFDQLGLSAEDMFNMLVNGAESGTFSVDKLGDAVKEFGIRVKDGTANDAFKELGLNVNETTAAFGEGGEAAKSAMQKVTSALFAVEDSIKQNQLGVAMFGTMWEDLGADGVKALTDISGEVNSTTEALDKINQQKYNDLESTLEGLKRSVQTKLKEPFSQAAEGIQANLADLANEISNGGMGDALDRIAEGFGNLVTKATEVVTAALPKVLEGLAWIADNGEMIVSVLAGIGAGFAVFKVATLINTVTTAMKGFKLATAAAEVVQKLLNITMAANPAILIATLIATLVAAIVGFIATNEKARTVVANVWEAVKNAIGTVVEGIVTFFTETIPNAFNQVINFVKSNWQGLLLLLVNPFAGAFKLLYDNCEGFRNIINNLVEQIKTAFNGVVTFLKELPSKIWNAIISTVDAIRAWALDLKTAAVEGITELVTNVVTFFSELPNKIAYVIGFCIGHVIQFGVDLYTWATTKIPEFVNSIITFMQQLPGKIWNAIVSAVQKVATWGEQMKTQAVTKVTQLITNVITFMQQLPGKIWNAIVSAVTKVATWGEQMRSRAVSAATSLISQTISTLSQMPSRVWGAISGAIQQVVSWGTQLAAKGAAAAKGLFNAVVNGVSSLPGKMAEIGSNIVSGIWNGISSGWDWLKNKVSSLASSLLQGAKDALGIKSPSRLFRDLVGKMIPKGIGVGITAEMPTLQKDLTDELQGMTTKVSAEVNPVAAVKKTAKITAIDGEVNTKKVTKDKDITVIVYTTNTTTLDKKVIAKEVKKEVVKGITKDQNDKDKTRGAA